MGAETIAIIASLVAIVLSLLGPAAVAGAIGQKLVGLRKDHDSLKGTVDDLREERRRRSEQVIRRVRKLEHWRERTEGGFRGLPKGCED